MKAIFISLVYEVLIWTAFLFMPHSLCDWKQNYGICLMYGFVVGVIQIVVYFLFNKILPMSEESSYKKHFWSFVIIHIVITPIIWLMMSANYRKENVGFVPEFGDPVSLMIAIIVFLGGEKGICVLLFSDISIKISLFVGFLLNKKFRWSEKYE